MARITTVTHPCYPWFLRQLHRRGGCMNFTSLQTWLTTEVVVGALLATSFTTVGLLSLWAATSPRHWFVRTVVVLALLSPILVVPAYELFLAVVLAIGVTCIGIMGRRFHYYRKNSTLAERLPRRFSLRSGFLVVSVLAVALAIGAQVPNSAWQMSWMWSIGGVVVGVATFMASFLVSHTSKWWQRGLWCLVGLQNLIVCFSVYGESILLFSDLSLLPTATFTQIGLLFWTGTAIVAAMLLIAGLVLGGYGPPFWRRRAGEGPDDLLESGFPAARPVFVLFFVVVAGFPMLVLWNLLNPLPIPIEPLPNPNGHARLVNVGMRLERTAVLREYMADPVDYTKLAIAVAKQSADFAEIREALELSSWIPVAYDAEVDLADTNKTSGLRSIQRALAAQCEVSFRNGDMDTAIAAYSDMLRLADAAHRGGLAIDYFIAAACEESAHRQIYPKINSFGTTECLALLNALSSYDGKRRDIDDLLYRERVWIQREHGWVGHLIEVVSQYSAKDRESWNVFEALSNAHRRDRANALLMKLELAVHAYQHDHGEFPAQLEDLVSGYLPQIPADPFDRDRRPIRYRFEGASYVLYSVGPDGLDDEGKPISERSVFGTNLDGTGDLRLDVYFAPEPAAAVGSGAGPADEANADFEATAADKQALGTPGGGMAKNADDENEPPGKMQNAESK